jgi:hypothetical protein
MQEVTLRCCVIVTLAGLSANSQAGKGANSEGYAPITSGCAADLGAMSRIDIHVQPHRFE